MDSDIGKTPFAKQLVSSDREAREKALQSLTRFLTAPRTNAFSSIEVLKIWKSLFFTLYHTPPPLPAQRLTLEISHTLFLGLSPCMYIPFLEGFWTTMCREYESLDGHRMGKYLLLCRRMLNASLEYLKRNKWQKCSNSSTDVSVPEWVKVMERVPLSTGRIEDEVDSEASNEQTFPSVKTPDGIRYHVLDIYVDELIAIIGSSQTDTEAQVPVEQLLEPVRRLQTRGWSKVLRKKAGETLADAEARLKEHEHKCNDEDEEEWNGIEN